ncbi:MAG: KilA-N domain-containing protein [Fusobacterium ulcerans]|uniref:KilA-N domain-containing protein n=1 Tax=Fusobacterium ulcerans TaxID=861 RepID=UPI003A8A0909
MNVNKMAEVFGGSQKLKDWKRSENTKRYIEALEKVMGKNSTSQLVLAQKGNSSDFEQGTWIHVESY